jgi:hypothetical protein
VRLINTATSPGQVVGLVICDRNPNRVTGRKDIVGNPYPARFGSRSLEDRVIRVGLYR